MNSIVTDSYFIKSTAFIGLISFTINGFLYSKSKKLGIISTLVMTFITTIGGSFVRDLLILHTPAMIFNYTYQLMIFTILIICYILKLDKYDTIHTHLLFILSDIVGTLTFAAFGAIIAMENQYTLFGTLVLSFVSAFGGTIARDIMLKNSAAILNDDFYEFIVLFQALILYLLKSFNMLNPFTFTLLIILCIVVTIFPQLLKKIGLNKKKYKN
jgi:uncharacterized membrane protein YeiH